MFQRKTINNTLDQKTMKTSRTLKMVFIFIAIISSCTSDDNEINQTHELVGRWQIAWQLNDSGDSSNYELNFLPDNSGGGGSVTNHSDGTGIAFYATFTWSTTDNPKTLIIPEMVLNTPYSINADGQLILNNFLKGEPFNKIN